MSRIANPASPGAHLFLPILLLAFGLRAIGLPDLHFSGDAAWSVYIAVKSLPDLTLATAIDSHPPLFYYLLHFWVNLAGTGELPIRVLSAFTGLMTVAVTGAIAHRLLGPRLGLLAALLAAVSPFLVYFDRMPRMYSLLALLAAIALYLALRLLAGPSRLAAGLYLGVILAALYTHYYAVFVMAAGFLVIAIAWRRHPRWLLGWTAGHFAVLLLFVPWLLYILGPSVSATTQAYGAIDLARPSNVLSFLSRFWVALNVGDMLEVGESRLLSLPLALLWIAGLALWLRRYKTKPAWSLPVTFWLLLAFVFVPLMAVVAIFIATPYVPFTRLLLLSAPAYLVLLAWALGSFWLISRLGAAGATALTLAVLSYSLAGTFYADANSADIESVEASQRLGPLSGPDDAVIFQALWHAGYLKGRATAAAPVAVALSETSVADLPALLEKHPKLWLSMFSSGKREASYPQEEWLDRNAYKAAESWQGRSRLALYGGRPDPPLRTIGADFGGVIRLEEAGLAPQQVRANEVVRLFLRWRALQDPVKKYVGFVHLIDENGRGCTGRDAEPADAVRPTDRWKAGDLVDDRRGLLVGSGVPPGRYYLALGLYPQGDWQQRLILDGGRDQLLLGPLEIATPATPLSQGAATATVFPAGIELLGYQLEARKEVRVVRNVDGPVELWLPARLRAGDRLPVSLRWRAREALGDAYRVRLEIVDSSGRVWGQAPEGPLGADCPTFRWVPGEVVSQTAEIVIRPDAPPGAYSVRATILSPREPGSLGNRLLFGSVILERKD